MRLLNHGSVPEEEISKMKDALNLEHVSRESFLNISSVPVATY